MDSVDIIARFIDEATGPMQSFIGRTVSAFSAINNQAQGSAVVYNKYTSSITQGLLGLSQTHTNFGNIVGSVFGGLGKVVGGAIGGIKNWLTDLGSHMRWTSVFMTAAVANIGSGMLEMAGSLEQTRVGFELLLKDEGKVREALTFIKQWALETPFSVNEATDSFKRFLAITGDVPTTEKFMRNLGDAVVATGGNIEEFNFAARGLTQMLSMSKVRAQEMYQLVNANIPAFDILAKAIQDGTLKVEGISKAMGGAGGATKAMTTAYQGATTQFDMLVKRSEAAEQKLQELDKAGKKNTSTFTSAQAAVMSAHLALDKAQKSIKDYTTAQAGAKSATDLSKMSIQEIKGQLQSIGDLNISGAEAVKIFSAYFEKAYGGAAKKQTETLVGQIGVLKDNLYYATAALLGYNIETGKSYGLYALIKNGLASLNAWLQKNKDIFEKLGKLLSTQVGQWTILGMAVGLVAGAVIGIIGPVVQTMLIFAALGVGIGWIIQKLGGLDNIMKALAGFWNGTVIPVFQTVSSFVSAVFGPVVESFKQSWAELQATLAPLMPTFDAVGKMLVTILGIIAAVAGALISGILMAIPKMIEGIVQMVAGIIAVITGFFALLIALWNGNWDQVKVAFDQIANGIGNICAGMFNFIIGGVIGFVKGVDNFFQWLVKTLTGVTVPKLVDTVVEGFNSMKEKALNLVGSLAEGIKNVFTGLASSALNWGKNMIHNMIQGIKDAIAGAGKLAGKLLGDLGISKAELGAMQHGGIVPGPVGAAVPIIAHGGERITPRTGADVGGGTSGVSINFYGGVMLDSEARIDELVNKITRVLGRQNEMARYGVGY